MAEERLIDDDKDRKYKIRVNADGEEELIIDNSGEEEEESDIPVFGIPVYEEDDEEAALLTPEQLAERERLKREEQEKRERKLNELLEKAKEKLEERDFEAALYAVTQAQEYSGDSGLLWCLKLKILTRNFTEFNALDDCAEVAENVKEYADAESKAELRALAGSLPPRIAEVEERTKRLAETNEAGKEERRDTFLRIKTKALTDLLLAGIPLLVFVVLTGVFASMIFSNENGAFVIATIVFAALTVIALIVSAFALRNFISAMRNVKLNESDVATKAGREYLESKKELDGLKTIYGATE